MNFFPQENEIDLSQTISMHARSSPNTNVTNNNQLTNGAGYITSSGSCASATSASTAGLATNVTVSANNSTDETVYLTFTDGATGSQGIETDTGLSYNPSSGLLTVGVIDGGNF